MRDLIADHRAMNTGGSIMESSVNARVDDLADHIVRSGERPCHELPGNYGGARQCYVVGN